MKILPFIESEKQVQMLEQLKLGTVMVFLDTRKPGVTVPDQFRTDFQLRLNFDYAFEIEDFKVLPDHIEASLSFNRQKCFCVVPFSAVYLMVSHSAQIGALFPESIPKEMLNFFNNSEPVPSKTQSLSLVNQGLAAIAKDELPPAVKSEALQKKRPHLRVVK